MRMRSSGAGSSRHSGTRKKRLADAHGLQVLVRLGDPVALFRFLNCAAKLSLQSRAIGFIFEEGAESFGRFGNAGDACFPEIRDE